MTLPMAKVEIAFASPPDSTSPSWVDVTDYVNADAGITYNRGRADETANIEPGKASFTLYNDDGRFTFGQTTSPYYPNVIPLRRVKISARSASGAWYPRFSGTIDAWPTRWDRGGADTVAVIQATELLSRLTMTRKLRSVPVEEMNLTALDGYYPITEAAGTAAGDASGNGFAPLTARQQGSGGTLTFGSSQAVCPDADETPGPVFAPASDTDGLYLAADTNFGTGGVGFTMQAFVNYGYTGDANPLTVAVATGTDGITGAQSGQIRLAVDGSHVYADRYKWTGSSWASVYSLSAAGFHPGQSQHVAVTESRSGTTVTATLYLNGYPVATATYTATATFSATIGLAVGGGGANVGLGNSLFQGTITHVATRKAALSSPQILSLALNSLFDDVTTGAKVQRIMDYLSLGASSIDTGDSRVEHIPSAGRTAIDVIRDANAVEGGLFFTQPTGVYKFAHRTSLYNPSPAFTLDCSVDQVDPDFTASGDTLYMVNDVTVHRQGGISVRVTDTASQSVYGLFAPGDITVYAESDDQALAIAQSKIAKYANPEPRTPTVTVNLLACPEIQDDVLPADLGSVMAAVNLPAAVPGSDSPGIYSSDGEYGDGTYAALPAIAGYIEGMKETIALGAWTITFNTSPAADANVWQLGRAGYSELGSTTRLALSA